MWGAEYLKDLPALALLIVGLFVLFKIVIKPITRTFEQGIGALRGSINDLSTYLRTIVTNDQDHIKKLLEEDREDRRALRLVIESLVSKNSSCSTDSKKAADETRHSFSGHA